MGIVKMLTKLLGLLVFSSVSLACKKSQPPPPSPPPKCLLPKLREETSKMGAQILCSGFGDRYLNEPKSYEDLAPALSKEGGVVENGTMVIKKNLIVPKENPDSTTCHLLCPSGFVPDVFVTECHHGKWSKDPSSQYCISSPCGSPSPPTHGRYWCYGNPATCYLTCDPGYVSMDKKPFLKCEGSSWDKDSSQLVCEEAIALITGGIGESTYEYKEKNSIWPESCQTTELFSLKDEECSKDFHSVLKIGTTTHTTHLVNGEVLLCGGNECGRTAEEVSSGRPMYKDTEQDKSCFKLEDDNSWSLHSEFDTRRQRHIGGLQMNKLQLAGGLEASLKAVIELDNNTWSKGRTPALPVASFASGTIYPCMVVTSPHTFLVIGGSQDMLKSSNTSSVVEYNSLTGEWRSLPDLPVWRSGHACVLVTTKSGPGVLLAGGSHHAELQKTVHLLDLRTERWFPAGTLRVEREEFGLAVLGERIVVLGSYYFIGDGYTSEEETVEEYVVPCTSLRECQPSQEGTWTLTSRVIGRRKGSSVLPVAASKFGCQT